jgi:hypothetical protein
VVSSFVLLAACAGGYERQTSLRNAVDEFHDGFRWGGMGSMLPHVRPEDQEAFTAGYEEAMRDVSIADYEVFRIRFADDGESALVWVNMSWYREDEMIVHEATLCERWIESGSTWVRTEVTVERGEMPGVPPAPAAGVSTLPASTCPGSSPRPRGSPRASRTPQRTPRA